MAEAIFEYRDYREGDEQQILALFREVFHRELSLEFWKWRFINNPFGRAIIKLCLYNNKLIGHYAVCPMKLQIEGKSVDAAFSMTTMTHPVFAGRGIFSTLAEKVYQECAEKGYGLVYGFPNANSYYGFIKKLGWQVSDNLTVWEKHVLEPLHANPRIIEVESFDRSVNLLWSQTSKDFRVCLPRKEVFLNWRFKQNPDVKYAILIYKDETTERLSGYAVLKPFIDADHQVGHIVDMLTADNQVAEAILNYSYDYFARRGINTVTCLCENYDLLETILAHEGFVKRKQERMFFGYRIFNDKITSNNSSGLFNKWFITMGDSDVF